MPFTLRVTHERPSSPEQDPLRAAVHKFIVRAGAVSPGSDPTFMLDLVCDRFLAEPKRFWTADELVEVLSTNKVTLKNNMDRLRDLDLIQEENIPSGGKAKKGYRFRYGSLSDAFRFTMVHADIILPNYRKDVVAARKVHQAKVPDHDGDEASARTDKTYLDVVITETTADIEDPLERVLTAMGYLSSSDGPGADVQRRLMTDVFLARPEKWWPTEELAVHLDANPNMVYKQLSRLRSLYLVEEKDAEVEEGHRGKAKRLYRLRFSNLTRGFDFLEGNARTIIDEYLEEVKAIEDIAGVD